MIEFTDDESFLQWADAHPAGFVLNAYPGPRGPSLKLHRATCLSLTGPKDRDTEWRAGYSRRCSRDRTELDAWVQETYGIAASPCRVCKP